MEQVARFANTNNLSQHVQLLQKGALVAQSPGILDSIEELDASERQALREEVTHRWRHPRILYFTIVLNSISAAIQGWDQTGIYRLPPPKHRSCFLTRFDF